MLGWIIYHKNRAELTPEAYEIQRFLDVAEQPVDTKPSVSEDEQQVPAAEQ